jgi:hypothetical protein
MADAGRCCTRDYAMEESSTGVHHCSGQPHLVEGLQEQDVQGATSSNKDSVELYILDGGADNERILPQLRHKVWVVTAVKGDGDLRPL